MDKMELDSKQKVLLAIYTEYQKDLPQMKNIKPEDLGLSREAFFVALEKLHNERLINDVSFVQGGRSRIPIDALIDRMKMSAEGIEYVEEKLKINKTDSGHEKVKTLMKKSAEWGWDQAKDFGARVLSEMLKG